MTINEIPLIPNQSQRLTINLSGVFYGLALRWNGAAVAWIMDISDANGNLIAGGLPIVTGADILAQLDYLGFTGAIIAQTDHAPDAVPTLANLGSQGHLYYVTA